MSNDKHVKALQLVRQLADTVAKLNDAVANHAAVVHAAALSGKCALVSGEVTSIMDALADELGETVEAIDDDISAPVPVVGTDRRKPVVR